MTDAELGQVTEVLGLLGDAEAALAELYAACAEAWPADAVVWRTLERDERMHAVAARTCAGIVRQRPNAFTIRHDLDPVLLRAFLAHIRMETERVNQGGVPRAEMIATGREIEVYLIENRLVDFLATRDEEYRALTERVRADTAMHRGRLERMSA